MRLAPIGTASALGLCEGIETGLAVMTACPGLPVWATLSTSGLEQVQLPPEARRIIILADNDASGAGLRAAETARGDCAREGRRGRHAMPPRRAGLQRHAAARGPRGRRRHRGGAAAGHEPSEGRADDRPAPADRICRAQPGHCRHCAPTRAISPARSTAPGALLLASNRTPWVFRFAGLPSWVVPDDEGRPVAATLTEERLRHMLAKLANWRRMNSKGELVPAPPPTSWSSRCWRRPIPACPCWSASSPRRCSAGTASC